MPFWLDQSGSRSHAYQLTAHQPQASATNGTASVKFTATNDYYFNDSFNITGDPVTEPVEAYIVLKVVTTTPTTGRGLWLFGPAGTLYPDTNGNVVDGFSSTSGWNTGTPPESLTQYHIYNVVSAVDVWANRINSGVVFATTNNTADYSGSFSLGSSSDGTYFDGNIAEMVLFDRPLSVAERNTVFSYLANRYSISVSPPAPPTNTMLITALSDVLLQLAVTNSPGDTASLNIQRKTGSAGTYGVIGAVDSFVGNDLLNSIADSTTEYFYQITASNYGGLSSPVVIAPPTVLLASPVTGTPITAGSNVTVTSATADDPDGSVRHVCIYNRSDLLATFTNSPYATSISASNLFDIEVSALAIDNQGNSRISPVVNLPVYPSTSGDGRNDALDIMLGLDPSTNTTPLNPTNHTPPTIHLLQPTNATPY